MRVIHYSLEQMQVFEFRAKKTIDEASQHEARMLVRMFGSMDLKLWKGKELKHKLVACSTCTKQLIILYQKCYHFMAVSLIAKGKAQVNENGGNYVKSSTVLLCSFQQQR